MTTCPSGPNVIHASLAHAHGHMLMRHSEARIQLRHTRGEAQELTSRKQGYTVIVQTHALLIRPEFTVHVVAHWPKGR